jgi:DNA-directed RNA polymerase subunit beta'
MSPLVESGEVIEHIGDRILGRVALEDVVHPHTEEVLHKAGEEIDEAKVRIIEDAGIQKVKIRSVLTCETKRGVCVRCYGRDLSRGTASTSVRRSASSPPSPSASRVLS